MIPIAKEFLREKNTNLSKDWLFISQEDALNAMKEFAKLHVTAALTQAHYRHQQDPEDLDFTLDAYPLENIK